MIDATNAIVRNYAFLCGWLEAQDLRQQAELAKLEAAKTWKDGSAPLEGWQAVVMRRSLWAYTRQNRAPITASINRLNKLDVCRSVDLEHARSVPTEVATPEERLDRHRFAKIITRILALLPGGDLASEVLLEERKPAEVAQSRRVPVREVYQATREARQALQGDRRLRAYAEEYLGP